MTDGTKKRKNLLKWFKWGLLGGVILGGVLVAALCIETEKNIPQTDLPAEAQTFLATYYPDESAVLTRKELDELKVTYTVFFADGLQLSFRGNGAWLEVESPMRPIADELIPAQIREYVARNFAGATVTELHREKRTWEVKLNNSIELKFDNKHWALVEFDD